MGDSSTVTRDRTGRAPSSLPSPKVDDLIAVARSEFARLGYRGVTMRGIAAAAGVSTRTVYNLFEDKLSLFVACVNGAARMPRIQGDGELPVVLQQVGNALLNQLSSPLSYQISIMIFRDGHEFPDVKAAARHNFEAYLVQPLTCLLARNGIPASDAPAAARLFANMITAEWKNRILFGDPPQTADEAAAHALVVTRVFLSGVKLEDRPASRAGD